MATINKAVATAERASNETRRQIIRQSIETNIKNYFSSTLATEQDIVNVFLAQVLYESSFNVNAVLPYAISYTTSSAAAGYYYSNVIQNMLKTGSPQQKANEPLGRKAIGLTQSMGWNHVRGASKNGKCYIESIRPDLADRLCVNPGDDITSILLGDKNIDNSILSGLAVLENKWKSSRPVKGGWSAGGTVFSSRLAAAVGAYLGNGKADANGTTPQMYAASIVGGDFYVKANGVSAPAVRDSNIQYASASANGPLITVASGNNKAAVGCISKKA